MKSTIPQSDPEAQIRVLIEQGVEAARQGDPVRADRFFKAVLEKDPEHEEAWLWRAAVAEGPDDAEAYLERVLAMNPDNFRAQAGLRWARERMESGERLPRASGSPAWGGVVALAPLEPEETRWQWWHAAGLIGALLLVGALLWWRPSRVLELAGLLRPQPTETVFVPPAESPAAQVPLPATATAIPTATPSPLPPTATSVPSVTPSPLSPTASAVPSVTPSPLPATATGVPSVTPSPLPPTATAVPALTPSPLAPTETLVPAATPSPVPTLATVWPTPGPTGAPVVTPRPTEAPSSR